MTGRRTLSFANLDEVMPEVERLLAGHTTVGRWSLGQICNHLAATLRVVGDGSMAPAPWIVRRTVGPVIRRVILRRGRLPAGVKAPAEIAPTAGTDARAEADALRRAIASYREARSGRAVEHPVFGRLTPAQADRIHCIHCAHHLSFVVPSDAGSRNG